MTVAWHNENAVKDFKCFQETEHRKSIGTQVFVQMIGIFIYCSNLPKVQLTLTVPSKIC